MICLKCKKPVITDVRYERDPETKELKVIHSCSECQTVVPPLTYYKVVEKERGETDKDLAVNSKLKEKEKETKKPEKIKIKIS